MTGPSPSPWSVTSGIAPDREGRLIVEDCLGNPVCATSARGVQGRRKMMDANANLISAAPDLYAALERIYGRLLMSDRDGDAHITEGDGAMAEAALRKARGEE